MTKNTWILLLGIALIAAALIIASSKNKQVQEGDTVTINYTLMLYDGTVYYSSIGQEPLKVALGQSILIPGFEEQVIGMRVGESRTFTLPPEKAYGSHRPDLIGTVERSWLPEGVEPVVGKQLQTELKDGTPAIATIIEFTETTVTLDANHPLVGQTLTFDIRLIGIENNMTPASPNQIMFGWLILVLAVVVAAFLLFRTRNLQISINTKRTVSARSKHI